MCRSHRRQIRLLVAIGAAWAAALVGCACQFVNAAHPRPCGARHQGIAFKTSTAHDAIVFPERMSRGYTLVLPGVWGDQSIDYGIVNGLGDAQVDSAVEIYDWTCGPMHMLYNLRSLKHNCEQAQKIADHLVEYQARFPGRPVNLVGYSGGGGLAVLTLEALPDNCQVTNVVLLGPTLAADYDLRRALSHVEGCLHNFYSPLDVPVLMLGCTVFGTTEGRHAPAAGAIGFCRPPCLGPRSRRAYDCKFVQTTFDPTMMPQRHLGGHFGWSNRSFVAKHVAPLLDVTPPNTCQPLRANHDARR